MNTNYWKVFFLDNDEHEPVASDRDSYTTPESMLPASGWWEFQPHEGLGWSQLLYVEMDLHLHLSENEWREYVEARQKCLAEQDFRQCDWLEPYGSIEQRWRDSEVFGRMRICAYCCGGSSHGGYQIGDGKIRWAPPGVGVGSADVCPYPSW